jgi:hypothetical protein
MTRIRAGKDGAIQVEAEVRYHREPFAGLLHHGTLNILAERTVKTLANQLASRIDDFDWYKFLMAVTYMAKERYRIGEPPVALVEVEAGARPRWLVKPIVEFEGPTVVAAPGGSNKSMLSLAIAATVATGRGKFLGLNARKQMPVLYLDWEADQWSHKDRLTAMCAANGIEFPDQLYYRREYAPLVESADELAKHVAQLAAGMVVIDSKGAALGGAPEEAEGTLRFFRGIRKLRVPALIVDHLPNSDKDGKRPKRPFGSVYTQNMARNVWIAEIVDQGDADSTVLWRHTKSNNGPATGKLAWRLDYTMDGEQEHYETIAIHQINPRSVTDLAVVIEKMTLREQITHHLTESKSPLSIDELANLTGASNAVLRARLNEGRDRNFYVNVGKGGAGQWMLASRYRQEAIGEELPSPF